MRKCIIYLDVMLLLFFLPFIFDSCKKNNEEQHTTTDIWDIDKDPLPRFVAVNYIESDKIYRISKFRSSIGHDYSDAFEHCRSMKHYFEPKNTVDWSTIKIYSPVTGEITRVDVEWAGTKLEIAADLYPAFRFSIFHIQTAKQYNIGDKVTAGEYLGLHIGSQTMSDISVIVNDPTHQGRMVSYFDVLADSIFAKYTLRGIQNRADMVISKEKRDANPLNCNGDTFISSDTLQNWVILK